MDRVTGLIDRDESTLAIGANTHCDIEGWALVELAIAYGSEGVQTLSARENGLSTSGESNRWYWESPREDG